ncbi:LLM class flavin-dependent oxidoreductase, partial [Bacillus sp. S34]|nr:LLM class flavin-dependent oxidoreductase [Bacillus sp. S34]
MLLESTPPGLDLDAVRGHILELDHVIAVHDLHATLVATGPVPELNLNDIKGTAAPSLEAWSLAAAIAATTERLEIMAAMRPGYHLPAVT